MKKCFRWIIIAGAALSLCSCSAILKNITYLQDLETGVPYAVQPPQELRVQQGDKLNIVVNCKQPELAVPFNIMGGAVSADASGNITTSFSRDESIGYTVDSDGNINFPLLGKLMVQGMTIDEVEDFIERRIKGGSYISDPIVNASFMNFQITVIGVAGTGNYTIPKNQFTLIELLGMIGQMPNTAQIDDILVIRTENNLRTAYSVNLKTKDLFDSPVYYLQQNDVVYVKPNKFSTDGRLERVTSISSTFMSMLNLVSNFFLWRYLFTVKK